jgi:diguanylate cyclase (GGDEF)-like protein/PAS domain S-box-containing protein
MSSAISLIDVRDSSERVVYVNAAFEELTGYSARDAVGRSWTIVEGPETDPVTAAQLRDAMRSGQALRVSVRHHRQNREPYWSETFLSPVVDEAGAVTHFIAVQKDVTERTEAERRAAHLAYHDPLTGLPNRAQVDEQLVLALSRARRNGTSVAVLFLDLDGFKPVNDQFGHDAGDQLLGAIADRWRTGARGGDVLGRYGGDEFVLLMTDLPPDQAHSAPAAAAERYAAIALEPVTVPACPDSEIRVSVSIGIARYPDDGQTSSELLMAADDAMYEAKRGAHSGPAARSRLAG